MKLIIIFIFGVLVLLAYPYVYKTSHPTSYVDTLRKYELQLVILEISLSRHPDFKDQRYFVYDIEQAGKSAITVNFALNDLSKLYTAYMDKRDDIYIVKDLRVSQSVSESEKKELSNFYKNLTKEERQLALY